MVVVVVQPGPCLIFNKGAFVFSILGKNCKNSRSVEKNRKRAFDFFFFSKVLARTLFFRILCKNVFSAFDLFLEGQILAKNGHSWQESLFCLFGQELNSWQEFRSMHALLGYYFLRLGDHYSLFWMNQAQLWHVWLINDR